MTASIVNAAPMTIMLGVQDKSTRALVPVAEDLPTHLPKVYLYTKKGPADPQLVGGASRAAMYGIDSFDIRLPWATHATVSSNVFTSKGNSQMIQRVMPVDAPPPASVRIYLDVLPSQLPVYKRNQDDTYTLDAAGLPIATAATVSGFIVKWVSKEVDIVGGTDTFGSGTQVPGNMVDQATNIQSVRYPIMDLAVPDFGEYGNNNGFRLWAPTSKSTMPVNDSLIVKEKAYPFRMSCVQRPSALTTPKVVETMAAEQFVNVCFKPDTIDSNTDSLVYVGDVFINAYQNLTSQTLAPQYGPFGKMKLYDDNVKMLLDQFYAAEKPFFTAFSDFKNEVGEEYRFNLISGMSSTAAPYATYQVAYGNQDSIRFSEKATVYASGGGDGTMNEALFAELVTEQVLEYANENSILQDSARYPESIMYDTGFPLSTKKAMCSFIAVRKDTALILSTHDVALPPLTASEESSLAIALRTRLQMYPESEFFGTSTVRGMIIGRSGTMLNNQYRKKLPLTLEIAAKSAAYMGAGNGSWKPGFGFDSDPLHTVDMFVGVNVTFTPATIRNKDWANGLNWVESYQRRSLYFPALKTVYDNDTSVLNSFFTMMICVECEKVGERARRKFSGVSNLTDAQLIERVNEYVTESTLGRFDNRVVIQPDAYYTAADKARGYSWTLPIRLYAPSMKTVGTLSIEAYRLSDLATA